MSVKPSPSGNSPERNESPGRRQQAWANASRDLQVSAARVKTNLESPLQVVDIDNVPALPNGGNALRKAAAAPIPSKMNGSLPKADRAARVDTDGGSVPFDRKAADVMDELDTPAEVPVDPFQQIINLLTEEHHRQIDVLHDKLEAQEEKLAIVLSSTWGFSEEGWHGQAPADPARGTLDLVCSKPRKAGLGLENQQNSKVSLFNVSEDKRTQMDAGKVSNRYKPRAAWDDFDWDEVKEYEGGPGVRRNIGNAYGADVIRPAHAGGGCYGLAGRLVVHPASSRRFAWDIAGMVLLLWDVIFIPISAYNPSRNVLFDLMDWITLVFWSCDMVASLLTGFVQAGVTVMDPKEIANHYMQMWFWFDMVVVAPDWCFTIADMALSASDEGDGVGDASQAGDAAGILRVLRIIRILRLLRLTKLRRILARAKDRITSEAVFLFVSVVQFVVGLIFCNHFISAMWYLVGDIGRMFDVKNWIEEHKLQDADVVDRYFNSLHWSLSQFAPGWFDSSPNNAGESLFAIIVLVVGMITCCYFTASLTNSMMRLNSMKGDTSKQFWLLRRYLRQHKVETSLCLQILRYLEYASSVQKDTVPEERLPVLGLLPDGLKNQLKYVVHYGALLHHPLFRFSNHVSPIVMNSLIENALSQKLLSAEEMQFKAASTAAEMYVVTSGKLTYSKAGDPSVHLHQDDWLCEGCLWVSWCCRGTLTADADSKLILVDHKAFSEVIPGDVELYPVLTCYALLYVDWLNCLNNNDITDLSLAKRAYPMVESMIEEAQSTKKKNTEAALRKAAEQQDKEKQRIARGIAASRDS